MAQDTKDVTTLGRGASDTTAVALAASWTRTCEIYTDVAVSIPPIRGSCRALVASPRSAMK